MKGANTIYKKWGLKRSFANQSAAERKAASDANMWANTGEKQSTGPSQDM